MLCAIILLLSISTTYAGQLFQAVEGNCEHLPLLKSYNDQQLSAGEWYLQYINFGGGAVTCSSGHAVQRGLTNYIDLLLYDSQNKLFFNVLEDLTYQPDKPGVYTNEALGITKHIVSTGVGYLYSVQCVVKDGKTKVFSIFATRARELDENAKKAYEDTNKMLEENKVFSPMNAVPQTDCPLLENSDRVESNPNA